MSKRIPWDVRSTKVDFDVSTIVFRDHHEPQAIARIVALPYVRDAVYLRSLAAIVVEVDGVITHDKAAQVMNIITEVVDVF